MSYVLCHKRNFRTRPDCLLHVDGNDFLGALAQDVQCGVDF
jgi:hypothetical protein